MARPYARLAVHLAGAFIQFTVAKALERQPKENCRCRPTPKITSRSERVQGGNRARRASDASAGGRYLRGA